MTARLHYDWHGGINRLTYEPTPYSHHTLTAVLAVASDFVRRHAQAAEYARMQPFHLLGNKSPSTRGLAWRWAGSGGNLGHSLVCFPKAAHAASLSPDDTVWVYRFDREGVHLVTGATRLAILGAKCELDWARDGALARG